MYCLAGQSLLSCDLSSQEACFSKGYLEVMCKLHAQHTQ